MSDSTRTGSPGIEADRNRSFIENAVEGIVEADSQGRIIQVNAALTTMLGFASIDEFMCEVGNMSEVWADPDECTDFVARVVATDSVSQHEARLVRRNGGVIFVSITAWVVRDDTGELISIQGLCRDMTESQASAAALRELMEAAQRANRAKNDFLSRMSHELRTPLNSILGFSQLMLLDGLDDEQKENAVHIERAGRHLLQLIDEVLNITSIEAGKMTLSIEPVRGADVVNEVVALLEPLTVERGIDLTAEIPEGNEKSFVLADLQRLKQILINLVSNAIKYNRVAGKVVVAYRSDNAETVRITVADTGHGIAPEHLERLFVPFDRLGAETTSIEGTGLGLAVSQKLVAALGGDLQVSSELGEGSVFTVTLARVDEPALGESVELEEPKAPDRHDEMYLVLYIEDNISNLRLVTRMLARRPDIQLITSMEGGAGLDVARESCPDAILLDLNLPDMGGEDVLKGLRDDPSTAEIPVVVLSADATKSKVEKLLEAGAQAYLTKPLDIPDFFSAIEKVLTSPRRFVAQ